MSSEPSLPAAPPTVADRRRPQRLGSMASPFTRPLPLALVLAFATGIPLMVTAVRVVQIPLGAWPEDALRLASAPVAWFLHSLAGVLFGVLGPLQFVLALRRRFGVLHRLAGRVFVVAGAGLALSGLAMLLQVESIATGLLDGARAILGLVLIAALQLAVAAARARDMREHLAWMVRAYAIGMGTTTVWLAVLPIYLITGKRLTGLASDFALVGMWLLSIAVGEWVVRRLVLRTPRQPDFSANPRRPHT